MFTEQIDEYQKLTADTYYFHINSECRQKIIYDYPEYPLFIRKRVLSHYPNQSVPAHWHEEAELLYLYDGSMKCQVNEYDLTLHAGEGLFINSRQVHKIDPEANSDCQFLCILFQPSLLCTTPKFQSSYILPLIQNADFSCCLLTTFYDWQMAIINLMQRMYRIRTKEHSPLLFQSALFQIWSLLYVNMDQYQLPAPHEQKNYASMNYMLDFIHTHYKEHLTLSQIAESGNAGYVKCCRMFSKYFHISPVNYLNLYRIQKSKDLLLHTTQSIYSISAEVGIPCSGYFSNLFKRWVGVLPSEFRKSARKKDQHIQK